MWVMGQLSDGSHGSRVTKDDPFPSLVWNIQRTAKTVRDRPIGSHTRATQGTHLRTHSLHLSKLAKVASQITPKPAKRYEIQGWFVWQTIGTYPLPTQRYHRRPLGQPLPQNLGNQKITLNMAAKPQKTPKGFGMQSVGSHWRLIWYHEGPPI